ncbi:hypothetical protein IJT93_12400 [bacterium]|nr:hypothetical protein [bacterium]
MQNEIMPAADMLNKVFFDAYAEIRALLARSGAANKTDITKTCRTCFKDSSLSLRMTMGEKARDDVWRQPKRRGLYSLKAGA